MGDGSRVVARCGSRQRALERACAKQSTRHKPECVETHARHRVHSRSPGWHGQNDAQARPNLVYALVRVVLRLGEVRAHAQVDQK